MLPYYFTAFYHTCIPRGDHQDEDISRDKLHAAIQQVPGQFHGEMMNQ
jgi:hypothetical protein